MNAHGGHVDGIASQKEWLSNLPLRNVFDYQNDSFRQKMEPDYYDIVFDCANGRRLVNPYFVVLCKNRRISGPNQKLK